MRHIKKTILAVGAVAAAIAYPALANLSQFDQFLTLAEGRPGPTPWAFMAARR